jgi:hypothetical protein
MASKVTASVTNARPRLSVTLVDAIVEADRAIPVASTARVIPNVSASYAAPSAVASYTIPAVDIAYINLILNADIDVSGLLKFVPESVTLTDGTVIAFTKTFADAASLVDVVSLAFEKLLADSISLSDSIETILIFLREFAEIQGVNDSVVLSFAQALSETLNITESTAISFEKFLSDGFAMNDSAEAGDGITFSFSTSIQNIVFTSDAEQKSFQKTRTDSVNTADSGFILQQDYIDLTYFAEDYVGVGYTF